MYVPDVAPARRTCVQSRPSPACGRYSAAIPASTRGARQSLLKIPTPTNIPWSSGSIQTTLRSSPACRPSHHCAKARPSSSCIASTSRLGPRLPEPHPLFGRSAAAVLLAGVETGDAPDRLIGDDRAFDLEDVAELAPDVDQACRWLAACSPLRSTVNR